MSSPLSSPSKAMDAVLTRQNPKKVWSKVFVDRILESHRQTAIERKNKYSSKFSVAARLKFARKVVEKIKAKMAHRGYSCKKSLDNLKPPTGPAEWSNAWPTQNMCFLCFTPCISQSIHCEMCDTVCHYNCILSEVGKSRNTSARDVNDEQLTNPIDDRENGDDDKDDDDFSGIRELDMGNFEFRCEDCADGIKYDHDFYKKNLNSLKAEREYKSYAMIIFCFCKTYIERKKFLRKKKALLLLQSCIRRRIANKKFAESRRREMRVILFEFPSIPNLTEYSLVVLTIYDTIKHEQLFRYDKFGTSALSEAILVPGINAHMTLVVTICSRKENSVETKNNPYTYFAELQATFALRDISLFMQVGKYNINLNDKIRWPVNESEPTDAHVVNSTTAAQDFMDFKSFIKKEASKEKIVIKYIPQNPMCSLCYQVQAVPLDALKRSVDMMAKKNGNSSNALSRTTRWWICLYNLKLYFYQFYGDSRPRFIGDITTASVHCMKEYNLKHNIPIQHADGRKWLVEFLDVSDAYKFEFAVNESQKAYREAKGSIYIRSENLHSLNKDFGHHQPIY